MRPLLVAAVLAMGSCSKGLDEIDPDNEFGNIDDVDPTNPDVDDPKFNAIVNLRTFAFAGVENESEEELIRKGLDNDQVVYEVQPYLLPEGDYVEDNNYSFERPYAMSTTEGNMLFFHRTKDGRATNISSGYCYVREENGGMSQITETAKYAPYGYEMNNKEVAFGNLQGGVFFANKGILSSSDGSESWQHNPEGLLWSSRDLSDYNPAMGGGVLPQIVESPFGMMMATESHVRTVQELVIQEILYDTLDMDGAIPIYDYSTPVDTVWGYTPIHLPEPASLIYSEDMGNSWVDMPFRSNDTLHSFKGSIFTTAEGDILHMGYSFDRQTLVQSVFRADSGQQIADTLTFASATTNISNDTPIAVSNPEIFFNPVTQRVELIEVFNHKLVLWSIDKQQLLSGSADWTYECELSVRGSRYADYAPQFGIGSLIDETNGVQNIYVSWGGKSPSAKAIYVIKRDLDTPALAAWLTQNRI